MCCVSELPGGVCACAQYNQAGDKANELGSKAQGTAQDAKNKATS